MNIMKAQREGERMNIKKFEFKKIISSPIFIILTLLFLGYNAMLIHDKSYIRDDLKVLNEIVSQVGYAITDDMMIDFQRYYENELNDAFELLREKGFSSFETIGEFFENNYIYEGGDSKFTSDEIQFLERVSTIEAYYFLSSDLEMRYDSIDINKIADKDISMSSYNENINRMIKKNYDEFAVRFDELKENGEHKNLFFYGRTYKMHSFLFKELITVILYEVMILIVLATAFLLNYEFESKTASVVYATKRGRNLIKDKLVIAVGVTILTTTIMIASTLFMYFCVFDYSGLWNTSVSNYFAQEYNMPYMSWWNMSVLKYLIAVILVVYILEIIFCGIAFMLSTLIKNTYLVFGSFAIMVGGGILLPILIPVNLDIIIATVYTPFTLLLNPSWWFMLKSGLNTNKYYEIVTLVVWFIGVTFIGLLCIKKFKRESIK